jgi:hypothetical protein
MNNILDNLFYKEKLGIGNKTTFIKNVRERYHDIIQEYLKRYTRIFEKSGSNPN